VHTGTVAIFQAAMSNKKNVDNVQGSQGVAKINP
jgi:hypothetical protein